MKKALLITLTAILLTSLASCSRRNQYENQLESQKEAQSLAESLADVPQAGANGEANIIGTIINPTDWNVTIQKQGDAPYFAGKTTEELYELYKLNGDQFICSILPTGRTIQAGNGSTWFYNKLTGNILPWCPDQLCDGSDCMLSGGWTDLTEMVSFVGEEHFYFKNMYKDFVYKLYRCDFQRNNVERLYTIPTHDGASNYIEIVCEEGNTLYFLEDDYGGVGGAAITSLKRLNMDTKEVEVISGDLNISWCYYIGGALYYQPGSSVTIYKNSLSFDQETVFMEDYKIVGYNDKYIIYSPNVYYGTWDDLMVVNLETGETQALPYNSYELAGDYVYYVEGLTAEEKENSPHRDYYEWRNDNDLRPPNNGSVWRMKIGSNQAEQVFTASYKDKPVVTNIRGVDGECLWLKIETYEQWQNYYNQDFVNSTSAFKEKGMMSDYLVMVDLHDGTMRFIETEGAVEEILTYK